MKMLDLYNRVIETTGLDIMTIGSLHAAVANCMADLTSRGYRTFKEMRNTELLNLESDNTMMQFDSPTDIRKIIYCRLYFNTGAVLANRYSMSNPRVQCVFRDGAFRSSLHTKEAIYYTKGDKIFIEWHPALGNLNDLTFGYYQKLVAPDINLTDQDDIQALKNTDIVIRKEFEDALVLYAAYFFYARYIKDPERIQFYLSNYKYYVEDITHELAYEDAFYEEDAVIKVDD